MIKEEIEKTLAWLSGKTEGVRLSTKMGFGWLSHQNKNPYTKEDELLNVFSNSISVDGLHVDCIKKGVHCEYH